MIKKNLIVLLLIPFLIALIGAAAVKTTYKMIDNDIKDISWNYGDVEIFKVNNTFKLEAMVVADGEVDEDNKLTWQIENEDYSDNEVHGIIRKTNDDFYLDTLTCGNVIITCSNKKGNVYRSMKGIIYDHAAIIITNEIQSSQQNIDNNLYYGEYDLKDGKKEKAEFILDVKVGPNDYTKAYQNNLYVDSKTSNIDFDIKTGEVKIKDTGMASITIGCNSVGEIKKQSYNFEIVKNGINVYTYEDLLNCTNKSTTGEIAVLRKSFESLENYNSNSKNGNVELFGKYDSKKKTFDFKNEIYSFTTTYNHEFIDKWNENASKHNVATISNKVYSGLRIQKDFYGNGYTINMHNLTFPTGSSKMKIGGETVLVPTLEPKDLFRGPLPFYALGDHNNMPLIEAFGQDNSCLYIDGNNIVVNDINIKNCDFSNSLGFLDYVGTTVDVNGNNNTIKNSRLSNGKNVLRTFSTNNFTLDNSILSNARNFLLYAGSNEYTKPYENKEYEFILYDGSTIKTTLSEYLAKNGEGDKLLTNYCSGNFDSWQMMYKALDSLQKALCDTSGLYDSNNNVIYKGEVNVNNSLFYRSGVASIGLDSMFDGAYLYSSIPSVINTILGKLQTQEGIEISKLLTSNTGGQSYPIILNVDGTTKFYDYKEIDNVDISGLIKENITAFAQTAAESLHTSLPEGWEFNLDQIFPVKEYLLEQATAKNAVYVKDGVKYINCPIAYYGGGYNLNKVNFDDEKLEENLAGEMKIDLVNKFTTMKVASSEETVKLVKQLMMKAITSTIGNDPFRFVCLKGNGYLYNEMPNVKELIKNNKKGAE